MAKLNFDEKLKSFDGTQQKIKRQSGEIDGTYGQFLVEALSAQYAGEENLAPVDKFERGSIAFKLHAGGGVELTVDQLAVIKAVSAKFFNPQFYFLVCKLIEDQLNKDA